MTDYSQAGTAKTETVEFKLTTFPSRKHQPVIEWSYPEFQCLCPVSQRHDQGTVKIRYKPKNSILESKSVRDYLSKWRNKEVWQEYVTDEIANFLYKSCEPEWLIVEIEWAPRGGIFARTVSEKGRGKVK